VNAEPRLRVFVYRLVSPHDRIALQSGACSHHGGAPADRDAGGCRCCWL